MLDKLGKMGNRPAAEIGPVTRGHVGTAARTVAKDVREGSIQPPQHPFRDRLSRVKSSTAKGNRARCCGVRQEVADGIHKMLVSEQTRAWRLSEMEKALPHVTNGGDHAALRRIDFALAEHGETTANGASD